MKLYIVRHGETDWNKVKMLQGQSNIQLNEYGRELAGITAKGLENVNFTHFFSSPLDRAYESCEIYRGNRDVDIITDERLMEIGFGVNEGKLPKDRTEGCADFFLHPELYKPDEGAESLQHLCARTKSFIDEVLVPLSIDKPEAIVLISGHGAMNKALMLNLKHLELKDFWEGKLQRNCAVNIYEINGFDFQIIEEAVLFYRVDENK